MHAPGCRRIDQRARCFERRMDAAGCSGCVGVSFRNRTLRLRPESHRRPVSRLCFTHWGQRGDRCNLGTSPVWHRRHSSLLDDAQRIRPEQSRSPADIQVRRALPHLALLRRLVQLDRIAVRIIDEYLTAAGSGFNGVPKRHACGFEGAYTSLEIIHVYENPIPTSRLLP